MLVTEFDDLHLAQHNAQYGTPSTPVAMGGTRYKPTFASGSDLRQRAMVQHARQASGAGAPPHESSITIGSRAGPVPTSPAASLATTRLGSSTTRSADGGSLASAVRRLSQANADADDEGDLLTLAATGGPRSFSFSPQQPRASDVLNAISQASAVVNPDGTLAHMRTASLAVIAAQRWKRKINSRRTELHVPS